jgi:ABC-type nitrate/sulfonate/bicarbonate transport system permease component
VASLIAREVGGAGEGVSATRRRALSVGQQFVALALAAAVFEIVSRFTPQYIVPGWELVVEALLDLDYYNVWVSVARIFIALAISFVVACAAAVLLYSLPRLEEFLAPIITVIMAVPSVSWVMFSVLWFKEVETRIIFCLAIVSTFIFLLDILDGMKGVPRQWRDMVIALRPTHREYFSKLVFPALVPTMLTSWKVNASIAVRVVTIAELVGGLSGIGYQLYISQQLFRVSYVYAWTLVLVLVLLSFSVVLTVIERRLLRWRD